MASTSHHEDAGEIQSLVGISFPDLFRAQEFLSAATRLASRGEVGLRDAVIVIKDENGRTTVHETMDPQPGRSALTGAVWASLFGLLLGGPVGWVAGAALGAGAGAATAKVVDLGIPDEWVAWFREAVQPDTATVALLLTGIDRNALVAEASRFAGGQLVYADLDDQTVERIRSALSGIAPASGDSGPGQSGPWAPATPAEPGHEPGHEPPAH